jgi:hypothetical protein
MSWSRFHNIRVANLTLYTYNYYMYAKRTLVYAPTSALVYIQYMDIVICTCIYGQPVLVQHSRWAKFVLLYTGPLLYCVCLTHVLQVIFVYGHVHKA